MLSKAYYLSRMGCFEIQGSARGITSVQLVDCKPCPTGPIPPPLRSCVKQLDEYFRGERQHFELTLDFGDASAFDISVWKALTEVPYGHTTTYSKIAEQLGDPKSVRAVGQANRRNPINRSDDSESASSVKPASPSSPTPFRRLIASQ